MNLNFFNNLEKNNNIEKNPFDKIQDFMEDLSKSLLEPSEDIDIVSKIISSHKVTLATENSIYLVREQAIKNYAAQTTNLGPLYYVYNKVKDTDRYRILKIENGTDSMLEVEKPSLPQNAKVNSAMRQDNNIFVSDKSATEFINNCIEEAASKLIQKQNEKINAYKKDGHIYLVTEDTNGKIFLYDTTSKPNFEIEEVNFPKDLLNLATEGKKFVYENGTYKIYE